MDAKIRRQSIDPEDLFYAHIGSMDTCARALIAVEKMINDGGYNDFLNQRYKLWSQKNRYNEISIVRGYASKCY
jgi:xylose isomerase